MMIKFKHHFKPILFCLLISIFMCLPFIKDGIIAGHDSLFHISRIEGMSTALANGDILPSIYPYKYSNYGYGSPMFYCDILLILPSILYNFGFSIIFTYQILIFLLTFLSALFMFYFISKFKFHKFTPYLGAMLYIFSNYRLTSVFVRGSIGEVFAYVFIPLVLIGIVNVLYKNYNNWLPLAVGFLGLALSHNITFVVICIMFFIYIILYYKNLINEKKRILSILKAIMLVILLSAFFTFGMLEQMYVQDFMFESNTLLKSDLVMSALNIWQLFKNEIVFGYMGPFESSMNFSVGLFATIVPFFHFFIINRCRNEDYKFVTKSFFVGISFLLLCTSLVPWEYLSVLNMIQFAFRFLVIPCTLLCFVSAVYYFELFKNCIIMNLLVVIFLFFNSLYLLSPIMEMEQTFSRNLNYHPTKNISGLYEYESAPQFELAAYDYLSPQFDDYMNPPNYVTDINRNKIDAVENKDYYNTSYIVNYSGDLIFPITYYKGYKVMISNLDNNSMEVIDAKMKDGKILVNIDGKCEVNIYYQQTVLKKIGIILSTGTVTIMLIYYIIKLRKRKE